jgi:hypothetical protein
MIPFQSGPPLPPDRLRAILGNAIMRQVHLGWRIESQVDTYAVMAAGNKVNHPLHLLGTILTCGAWLPVWVILGVTGGEKRLTITVDPHGVVLFNGRPAGPVPPMAPPPRGNANAQAIAAATMRRDLRRQAREQAAQDPLLARELRIGRPDLLPRAFDDGGLIDVNHVPPEVLSRLPGLTYEMVDRIMRFRTETGGFVSAEELVMHCDLPPSIVTEISEYALFVR